MKYSPEERQARAEAMRARWADPQMRAKLLAGTRKPRPGRKKATEEERAKRKDMEIHRRKRNLAYRLAKPVTAKADFRGLRRALTTLKPLIPLADWEALEFKYETRRYQVLRLRLQEKERREEARRRQWAEAQA